MAQAGYSGRAHDGAWPPRAATSLWEDSPNFAAITLYVHSPTLSGFDGRLLVIEPHVASMLAFYGLHAMVDSKMKP